MTGRPEPRARAPGARGAALAIVLWALVALAALAAVAAEAARLELALAGAYRDHAAALALAEAGVADALARIAGPPRDPGPGELHGALETGSYAAAWEPAAGAARIVATGSAGRASRTVEAWTAPLGGAPVQIAAWRETW